MSDYTHSSHALEVEASRPLDAVPVGLAVLVVAGVVLRLGHYFY